MSNLFRSTVDPTSPLKTTTVPVPPSDPHDGYSSSDSSSADSAASVNTVRPTSAETAAPTNHWTTFFAQELFLDQNDTNQNAHYHVYLTPPSDPKKGPLFICHHGAGVTGLSFALLAKAILQKLPHAGILSLEARSHGSVVTSPSTGAPIEDFSLATLAADATAMINLTQQNQNWTSLPPTILVGHSLGGAVTTRIASAPSKNLLPSLVGNVVIDVVEGSAVEALGHMQAYLSARPSSFPTPEAAVQWHVQSRTIRNRESAEASIPSLLRPSTTEPGSWTWLTNLRGTIAYWEDWFTGLSPSFLAGRCAKLLVLAGTDRLDKPLLIGQMQGKFQLTVIPEAGHFVQEDVPEQLAGVVAEFWARNDRSAMVLPPKVADLIKMGKKV